MDYLTIALILLALLQIKHWYIDFVNQTEEEVKHKGIYLDWLGVKHSLKHGFGTAVIVLSVTNFNIALAMGALDFILHYHIDWTKMNYGSRDITTPQFWSHLGLDQMAHQFCYLFIIFILV